MSRAINGVRSTGWAFSCVSVCRALGVDVRELRRTLRPVRRRPTWVGLLAIIGL